MFLGIGFTPRVSELIESCKGKTNKNQVELKLVKTKDDNVFEILIIPSLLTSKI